MSKFSTLYETYINDYLDQLDKYKINPKDPKNMQPSKEQDSIATENTYNVKNLKFAPSPTEPGVLMAKVAFPNSYIVFVFYFSSEAFKQHPNKPFLPGRTPGGSLNTYSSIENGVQTYEVHIYKNDKITYEYEDMGLVSDNMGSLPLGGDVLGYRTEPQVNYIIDTISKLPKS